MLTSLLPPSACASCRLCCNFSRASLWETPALDEEERARLEVLEVPLAERGGAWTLALEYGSEDAQECALCPLLDVSSGCMLRREERPLECRLWPLRLMRGEQGELLLACYRDCPGMAQVQPEALLSLVQELRPLLLRRAECCPASVRPLHPNYRVLGQLAPCPAC